MPTSNTIEDPTTRTGAWGPKLSGIACLVGGVAFGFVSVFDMDLDFAENMSDWLPLPILLRLGLAVAVAGFGLWTLQGGNRPASR